MQLSAIKVNPKNPRLIKDAKADKLLQSLLSFPQMLSLRPIVVDASNIALGGNMRLSTIKRIVDLTPDEFNAWISNSGATEEAAQVWQQVRETKKILDKWVLKAADLTEDQQREFTIKDNVSGGEWDWDILANEWDVPELVEWGLDLPNWADGLDANNMSEDDLDENEEFDIINGSTQGHKVVFIFDDEVSAQTYISRFPELEVNKKGQKGIWSINLSTQST